MDGGTKSSGWRDWVIKVNEESIRRPKDDDDNAAAIVKIDGAAGGGMTMEEDEQQQEERWKKRCIYRVPAAFAEVNKKAYTPLVVSLGPYHHGEDHLKVMEGHKHRALVHFLRRSGKPLERYLHALNPLAQDLKDAYDSLPAGGHHQDDGGSFLQVMIVDGCFLLEILRTAAISAYYGLGKDDYAPWDPVFSDHGRLYLIPHLKRDMLLLQNQLPMLLLYTLHAVATNQEYDGDDDGGGPSENDVEFINNLVVKIWSPDARDRKFGKCLHVLDLYRKNLLWEPPKYLRKRHQYLNKLRGAQRAAQLRRRNTTVATRGGAGEAQIVRSATELYEAGIRFKRNKTRSLKDISFRCGVLRLPQITVDDTSESMFLNQMAFERAHVGAGNEVTAYIFFMDTIIDSNKDVSLLHNSGVLLNAVGSDKAVAKLFNSLSRDITLDPQSSLDVIQNEVCEYCKIPWNEWRANLIHTYFRSPWASLSVFAAIFLFALTIVQTIYSILPYYKPS
ncbi:unnamed protein product [Cuscuta campestris]|uniref:Uncharacterized protein n=1 Tax=Cuscuta campestris TaxID=132261 RepID=A0A484LYL3_9ASTE|nr:unnamed protein product [Cuscuta campestris]